MALTWVKIGNLKGPKGDQGPQGAPGDVSAWKANTAYVAGQTVVSPGGDLVTAKVAFTSGASYSATNWNASSQEGRLGTAETKNTQQDGRLDNVEKTKTDEVVGVGDGAEGGLIDGGGRFTWLTHDASGGPTAYARKRLGIKQSESLEAYGGFLDAGSKLTWLTLDKTGGPTPYAVERMRTALGTGSSSATAGASNRHAMAENELRLRNGGTIRTNGAAPVVLIFDHGVTKFRDVVLPLLVARGLPSVLALNARNANVAENDGVTWAEIDGWVTAKKVEIANHGATHTQSTTLTDAQLYDEIVTGLAELRAQVPSDPVLNWVQPAASYPGFNDGNSMDAYTNTYAGRLIHEHHAVMTGTRLTTPNQLWPRDGNPMQGISGQWIDVDGSDTSAINAINSAVAAKRGLILRQHPVRIDGATYITLAQITAVLDHLKAEQDAGRVKVLNLSQWSIADTGA